METVAALRALAGRTVGRAITPRLRGAAAPLADRRHARILRRGGVEDEERRRAAGTWWGDDPRWYPGGKPPRLHNRVTPLIDGELYFPALREALSMAMDYVYVVGWCLTPHFPLHRGGTEELTQSRLLPLLTETARRVPVRMLLWSGAPALIQPTTRAMRTVQRVVEEEAAGADLQCLLDQSARFSHCHHQKAIVVDGRLAFVGGMDLTTFQGDRWDTSRHDLRGGVNWHDVQLRLEGEVVGDVEHNFRQRWIAMTGRDDLPHRAPDADDDWRTPGQIVRTIPQGVYAFASKGEYGIHHAYLQAIQRAERLIYLENQYLWSPDLVGALIAAMDRPRSHPFRIVIVLPARAYSGKWDNDRHVEQLRKADDGRGIVSIYCPYASGPSMGVDPFMYRPIYVHAKVGVIDDEWLTVGSANLNNRGLITDSEINAVVVDRALARELRIDLWTEHLALPREEVAQADPVLLIDEVWARRAAENATIIKAGDRPLICAAHRYDSGRMPGSWFLEEAELLTFER